MHAAAALALCLAAPLAAQPSTLPAESATGCGYDAARVREHWELGRFFALIDELEPCLTVPIATQQEIEVLTFLAKAYLVLDAPDRALDFVNRLLNVYPNYATSTDDPARFKELVAAARSATALFVSTSVSKTAESLREAPATVTVITEREIARRGYLDLEAVLHDLPGFDISRGSGVQYSSIYQRGYRSSSTDRILFLVDGVEENDVWSNFAYISRQYPLSNVERIEVIYGPASTMYGPNAFVGVINVITKTPDRVLEEAGGDKRWAVETELGGGTWSSRWTDVTLAGRSRNRNISASLTTRVYESDESDRSGFEDWDFDPRIYTTPGLLDYAASTRRAASSAAELEELAARPDLVRVNPDGSAELTDTGIALARERDRRALDVELDGRPIGYSDVTDVWSVYSKVRIYDFELGFMTWKRREGHNGWYVDNARPGALNGHLWTPEQAFLYLKYTKDLTNRSGLTLFSRFKRHRLDADSRNNVLLNYSNGSLDALDLVRQTPALWQGTRFAESSRQLRNEVTLVFRPTTKLNIVGGAELRNALLQGNYLLTTEVLPAEEPGSPAAEARIAALERNDTTGQFFDQLDFGLFAQASYRYSERWKFVAGGRLDHNEVDPVGDLSFETPDGRRVRPEGYGTVFNPRLAAIYVRPRWVFRALYSEAFKDASNFNRYAISPGVRDFANPELEPERVKNFELALSWQPHSDLRLEAAAYRADYSDAVGLEDSQNRNLGAREIFGTQSSVAWSRGRFDLWASHTYTDPQQVDLAGGGDQRVPDIARHQLKVGGNLELPGGWNLNLRANYSGARERPGAADVDAYTVVNATVTYEGLAEGLRLQAVINNALDSLYYVPGVRSARGSFAARIPQNERSFFVRAVYGF